MNTRSDETLSEHVSASAATAAAAAAAATTADTPSDPVKKKKKKAGKRKKRHGRSSAQKRLLKDFKALQKDPPSGISGAPVDSNIMNWQAIIFGPDDTVWEGGTFCLTMKFTEEYPNKPPEVKFATKIFHPNVYNDGSICLDILKGQWSPIYDISAILTSIQSLLCDPNPKSPANAEAARLFQENRREYNRRVKKVVEATFAEE